MVNCDGKRESESTEILDGKREATAVRQESSSSGKTPIPPTDIPPVSSGSKGTGGPPKWGLIIGALAVVAIVAIIAAVIFISREEESNVYGPRTRVAPPATPAAAPPAVPSPTVAPTLTPTAVGYDDYFNQAYQLGEDRCDE